MHLFNLVNYLSDSGKSHNPWELIAVYMTLTFLQGGGIGKNAVLFFGLIII